MHASPVRSFSRLNNCHNIADLRRLARRRLPAPIFHYMDGGADDEVTLRRNTQAFDDYELLPSQLTDVSNIDMSTSVLGQKIEMPLFLAPTAMSRLFNHEAEPAVARVAEEFGTLYSLSSLSTYSIEDVGAVNHGPKMFQVYIFKDRGLTREFVQRSRDAGYQSLCLTVDTPLAGNRERDLVTGMTLPPRFSISSMFSFLTHPHWGINVLRFPDFDIANVKHRAEAISGSTVSVVQYINDQLDRSLSWKDAEWLAGEWGGPFAIKGIQSPADARRAADVGATAVMLSNHGGRQLEATPAPVDCVAPVVDAVGDRLEVICDGGIRRGTHVLKALALGATAWSTGRGYLFGLAAGGEAGVRRAMSLLRDEIQRSMALLGCRSIAEIGPRHVQRRAASRHHPP